MNTRTGAATVTALIILLILAIPANTNWINSPPLLAQSSETDDDDDTSSASQDYQEFQSCLSDVEVDGTVSEQQIRDCFAPIYNTGTGTSTASDDDDDATSSPPSDEDTDDGDDNGSDDGE